MMLQSDVPYKRKVLSQAKLDRTYQLMAKRKVKGFYNYVMTDNLRQGALTLVQTAGLGKLKPNMLLMGFKCDWLSSNPQSVSDYVNIIQ